MSHAIFIKFFVFCISKASDYERLTFSLYSSLLNHGQGISKKNGTCSSRYPFYEFS